jgi:Uma2 family endonuclease
MNVLPYIPRYTLKDYNMWEGDWELIDGHPVAMSPSPVRRHQSLASKLITQIATNIELNKESCGDCEVVFELDWIVNDNTILRPDVAVICNGSDDFITSPPVLVIEVLSPSTALRDIHVKNEIYQEQGVKYYITADPATKAYQSYILTDKVYQPFTSSSYLIHAGCTISIDLAKAMAGIKY